MKSQSADWRAETEVLDVAVGRLRNEDELTSLIDRLESILYISGHVEIPARLPEADRDALSLAQVAAGIERQPPREVDAWVTAFEEMLNEGRNLAEVLGQRQTFRSQHRRVAAVLLQVGVRTGEALGLLNRHGYVRDARARWRALFELTCTATVLAHADNRRASGPLCVLYLAHIGGLHKTEPDYRAFWDDEAIGDHYEWMRPLFPANSSGKARRLRQGDLWDQSIHALEWPYREYLKNCHHDVHVIGRTVLVDGEERFDPVYHEPDPVLAAWSCAALYELSAACVLLAMIDEHEPLVNPRVAKQVNVWGHRVRGMMAHSSMSEPKP